MLLDALQQGLRLAAVEEDYRLRLSQAGHCARELAYQRGLAQMEDEVASLRAVLAEPQEPAVVEEIGQAIAEVERRLAVWTINVPQKPAKMSTCAEIGHSLEQKAMEWLALGGVEVRHRQLEVALDLGPGYEPVLGHLDCEVSGDGGPVREHVAEFCVDVKGVGEGTFRHLTSRHFSEWDFPNVCAHRGQAHGYAHARRLVNPRVQGTVLLYCNRSSGEWWEVIVPYDSREAARLIERLRRVVADGGRAEESMREHELQEYPEAGLRCLLPRACEWCDWKVPCWGELGTVRTGRADRSVPRRFLRGIDG